MPRRLLIALSGHGFGHLGQLAPVVRALRAERPAVEIVVRSSLPEAKLRQRLGEGIVVQAAEVDFGTVQRDALTIDLEATARRYDDFHACWDELLYRESVAIERADPALVLSDIPYLTLAACQRLDVPALALCSLNWAEIYRHYFADRPGATAILDQMLAAYNGACCFLRPQPAMDMPSIRNAVDIGPVAQIGADVRPALRRQLGLADSERLVLVSLGGFDLKAPCERWPRFDGLRLLVPSSWNSRHPDTLDIESLQRPFPDLIRACDAIVSKPGYGSFVEAACSATPVLYLPRPDWPEAPVLVDWLQRKGNCLEIDAEGFARGALQAPLGLLLAQERKPPVAPSGVGDAVQRIVELLDH
ncbi:MAG TPA: hypothetical protein ENK05_00620 [Gammaproteobacteria bacterium]|nr:hypothetical protein [Gammaproteobacteria bacterium]